jgi:cytochrome c oxidase assembly protein subunit 15
MNTSESAPRPFGPALTFGFGTAVAMWCAWWLTHHPAVSVSPPVAGQILLFIFAAGMTWCGHAAAGRRAPLVGALAGLVTSALNLLILGALIARPPEEDGKPAPGFEGLTPSAGIAIAGFLGAGVGIGLLGGAIGAALGRRTQQATAEPLPSSRLWLSRFSLVACIAVAPLILLGGAVTSTASGRAVPGWPDSYGANMFLYPISLMSHPRVFLEHTHRLFGSLVGLTTLTLMIWTLTSGAARSVKLWTVAAFILVCVQGVLGGVRVNASSVALAFVHGVTAQVFLAVLVCIAVFLSPTYAAAAEATPEPADRRRKAFSMALQHSTLVQLLLGAAYRHFGQVSGSMHALWTHAAFSLVVVAMALAAGFMLRTRAPHDQPLNRRLRRTGSAILAVVVIQFLLGWGAFVAVLHAGPRGEAPASDALAGARPVSALGAIIPTAHQANGALLLALATAAVVLTRRVWKNRPPSPAPSPVPSPA